jgi:DNA-binding CsgD family transcriptional regulator
VAGPHRGRASSPFLERGDILQDVEHGLRRAQQRHGGGVVVEGSAGIGKTALLGAVTASARALGSTVLAARATEFEAALGFGVVRQLLEARVRASDDDERGRLLSGAAARAGPILTSTMIDDASTRFAVLHGLYWLVARLADDAPLVLVVDDVQWADDPSRDWLRYLLVRLDELPVFVVLAGRPEPGLELLAGGHADRIRLRPLGPDSVGELVARRTGRQPMRTTVEACHAATGGNPLLVRELLDSIETGDRSIDEIAPHELAGFASESLVRRTNQRLLRLGPDAVRVADALAVLGDGATLADLADVARLDPDTTGRLLDALVAADLVDRATPASFIHPLLRTAVEHHLGAFERSELHERAARALLARDADPESVGLHLLATEPLGRGDRVACLRRAAATALRRGAPTTAVAFLRRALAEPPDPAESAAVLRELGEAELRDGDQAAVVHLEQALGLAGDDCDRAAIGSLLAHACLFRGEWDLAVARLRDARSAAGSAESELGARIEAELLTTTALDDRTPAADLPDITVAGIHARAATPRLRASALTLTLLEALGSRTDHVPALVELALDDGAFLTAHTADAMAMVHAVDALIFVDQLDDALAVARDMVADGERRASVLGVVAGLTHCGFAELRLGRLHDAQADCHTALDLAREHGLTFTLPFIAAYLSTTLLEMADVARANAILASLDPGIELSHTVALPTYLDARGSVRAALGDRDGAARDFRACGDAAARLRITNPNAHEWRVGLADALRVSDRHEAEKVARDNLARSKDAGSDRAIGVALRSLAGFAERDERVALLRASVDHLERSPCQLELARSLFELGASDRRAGRRDDAKDALLRSLQLATESGADALAARALDEARQTGARPRRPWTTGRAALTPAERRVALLAADGRTNQEIAQSLFVTTKTVKTHLGSVYRKLGIARRTELRGQLDDHHP